MSNLFFLFISIINLNIAVGQVCAPLPNGSYKVKHDPEFSHYPNFEFEIKDSLFISDGNEIKIDQNDYCVLRLEKAKFEIDENTTELEIVLSKSYPYYSFSKVSENKYDFILRPGFGYGIDIISSRGKFIKQ